MGRKHEHGGIDCGEHEKERIEHDDWEGTREEGGVERETRYRDQSVKRWKEYAGGSIERWLNHFQQDFVKTRPDTQSLGQMPAYKLDTQSLKHSTVTQNSEIEYNHSTKIITKRSKQNTIRTSHNTPGGTC